MNQATTTHLLKIYVDLLDDPRLGVGAQKMVLRIMQEGDVATAYVLRNIGKKRTKRLMEFLNGRLR